MQQFLNKAMGGIRTLLRFGFCSRHDANSKGLRVLFFGYDLFASFLMCRGDGPRFWPLLSSDSLSVHTVQY